MSQARTVLVCGAPGFVGSHAASALAALGWHVTGTSRRSNAPGPASASVAAWFTGDLMDRSFAERVVREVQPRRILFSAGPADVQQSMRDPVSDFSQQLLPLLNILSGARQLARAPGVLLVSSAAVYGQPDAVPVREDATLSPISPYGFHKLAQERLLAEFASLYGLPVSIARAFSTLGPGQRHLAVWDITRRALQGNFELPGTGKESRDYLYATDVGQALATIVERAPFEGEVINVASGCETPIRRIAEAILSELGVTAQPVFRGSPLPGSPLRWCADVRRLGDLGFHAGFDIETALKLTVSWIRAHG